MIYSVSVLSVIEFSFFYPVILSKNDQILALFFFCMYYTQEIFKHLHFSLLDLIDYLFSVKTFATLILHSCFLLFCFFCFVCMKPIMVLGLYCSLYY